MLKIYFITEKGGLALSLKWTNRAVLFKTYCGFFHNRPFSGICKCSNWKANNEKKRCLCSYWGFELLFLCASKGLFPHGNEKGPQGICFMKWLIYRSSSDNDGVFLDKKTGSEEALEVIFQGDRPCCLHVSPIPLWPIRYRGFLSRWITPSHVFMQELKYAVNDYWQCKL